MAETNILLDIDERGIATVTLDRPDKHNAFDDALIAELAEALGSLAETNKARVVVLAAHGKSFSAGADAAWMRRMASYSNEENLADARALAAMLDRLDRMPKPTIARVQGPAYGGGVGLIACCDIAIAVKTAVFAMTEVRLGLVPATVSPYIVAAIGARAARRYFQTGERFGAGDAHRLGLLHEVVEDETALTAACQRITGDLLAGAPGAIGAAKDLVHAVAGRPVDDSLMAETARRIAERRATGEGREGVTAFLEKRKPNWSS